MTLSHERYLEAIAAESKAFVEAARHDLGAPVPSCPGWTVERLAAHLGEVHRFWTGIASQGLTDLDEVRHWGRTQEQPPEDGAAVVEWFEDGARALIDLVAVLDPKRHIWTWSPETTAAFVPRRMAQETAVHRWDAQNASGNPSSIAPDLAADGIDELLFIFLLAEAPLEEAPGTSLHIHTTNDEGEWLVRLETEPVLKREHAKGDAALRGDASEVLLALWGRLDLSEVEVIGDRGVVDDLRGRLDLE